MASLEKANVESPHETWEFAAHGHMDEFILGGLTLRRGTYEPAGRASMTHRADDGCAPRRHI